MCVWYTDIICLKFMVNLFGYLCMFGKYRLAFLFDCTYNGAGCLPAEYDTRCQSQNNTLLMATSLWGDFFSLHHQVPIFCSCRCCFIKHWTKNWIVMTKYMVMKISWIFGGDRGRYWKQIVALSPRLLRGDGPGAGGGWVLGEGCRGAWRMETLPLIDG